MPSLGTLLPYHAISLPVVVLLLLQQDPEEENLSLSLLATFCQQLPVALIVRSHCDWVLFNYSRCHCNCWQFELLTCRLLVLNQPCNDFGMIYFQMQTF
ncbi:hypothetical protein BJV82DRAFT_586547, partial [Fennellomyces sp. T-0311]